MTRRRRLVREGIALSLIAALAVACGGNGDNNGDGDGGNGDAISDGDGGTDGATTDGNDGDAITNGDGGACTPIPGAPECSDGCDNDDDGQIDGFDIECTGALDDDESSFSTGIPGDNIDTVKQDCFFDGNSGGGDDGCDIHVCCLLGAPDQQSCPFGANQYDPNDCTMQTQECIDYCGALTPPGCDCFGCCTVCDPVTNECFDIITNPATAPNCDADVISDPNLCPRCMQVDACGTPCDPANCILCPGQTEEDLPPECSGQECPTGSQVCDGQTACPSGQFCINGCCIDGVP